MNHVALIAFVAFLLNLPFGYWRVRYKKYSLGWFVCIHAPIPVVVFLRLTTHTPFKFAPVFLATSIGGQIVGSRFKRLIQPHRLGGNIDEDK
ncbi:conserved hypothetical protein [Thermosulfidibacter takaii ABI70S6]|uniref:Uncharacterized protein n=1 Tax=Thermosulfidibacter takaii (strain DSM 17441 / JCM 13301 / NBRC 103674 / ABI70S6) TaxID=1298851 RepID=A0A0S3QTK9_THET7|nr:hypothetical protein [Thermosulfidibacter takaii]BAT71663.1 conserved hypothetical protein [Thermosulfidibacter takaii ABI70S6]